MSRSADHGVENHAEIPRPISQGVRTINEPKL
jgi:hypothetical protein